MAAHPVFANPKEQVGALNPLRIGKFPRLRALAWRDDILYASRGYALLRARVQMNTAFEWERVGEYRAAAWRTVTASSRLASRLFRDGFHSLATLSSGHLVAAVPHAIVTLAPGETEFHVSHKVLRGIRPLHLTATPDDHIFWGEYFDNPERNEVHIYASPDRGAHWEVAHSFPKGAIRHVHNIVYDEWENCLWVLTGDNGSECRILRASCDFKTVELIRSGNQQARAVALVPTRDALYFSSDTPLETNHVYRLDRRGNAATVADLNGSSICGCRAGDAVFFSTMVEPSPINCDRNVTLYASADGVQWQRVINFKKDRWPMGWFQYGNAFLPDGRNATNLLAVTTIAVEEADLETSIWRI